MNAIVSGGTTVDRVLQRLTPKFANGYRDDRWRVEECNVDCGAVASLSRIVMKNTPGGVSESSQSMAFNYDNTNWLKVGMRCVIEKAWDAPNPGGGSPVSISELVTAGTVLQILHDRDTPALVAIVADDRIFLQNVRVVGRWISGGTSFGNGAGPWYQQGWGAHFNPGGRPNGIWYNGVPFFTPYPDWGLLDGEQPPAASERNEDKACYFDLQMMLLYLWNFYSAFGYAATVNQTQTAKFPWVAATPSSLLWSKDFANNIDAATQANFNSATGQGNANLGGNRKGRELIVEGLDILSALQYILYTAGGWTLGFDAVENVASDGSSQFMNSLSLVPTRYTSESNGVQIPFSRGGNAKDNFNRAVINGGSFGVDGANFRSSIAGAGQLVFIERLFSMDPGNAGNRGGAQILEAWSMDANSKAGDRFKLFRSIAGAKNGPWSINGQQVVSVSPGAPGAASFDQACRLIPDVMTQWKLNENFDYQEGTDQIGYPRALINRPPLPNLLSLLSDAGTFDFAGMRLPVYVEMQLDPTNPTLWSLVGEFDALEIFDNGNIRLPTLRSNGANAPTESLKCWRKNPANAHPTDTWPLDASNNLDILTNAIRMTLAIPCDHRLTSVAFSPGDTLSGGLNAGAYTQNPDADQIDPTFIRRDYADLQQLYALWLRRLSASRPQSLNWPLDPDKAAIATGALRSDFALLNQHLLRAMWDANRLEKTGNPRIDGYLVTSYRPGLAVKEFNPADGVGSPLTCRGIIGGFKLKCGEKEISTELKFNA